MYITTNFKKALPKSTSSRLLLILYHRFFTFLIYSISLSQVECKSPDSYQFRFVKQSLSVCKNYPVNMKKKKLLLKIKFIETDVSNTNERMFMKLILFSFKILISFDTVYE